MIEISIHRYQDKLIYIRACISIDWNSILHFPNIFMWMSSNLMTMALRFRERLGKTQNP